MPRPADGSGFRASENISRATPPQGFGFESAKGGFAVAGKGLENGPRRLYAPRRRVFYWGCSPAPLKVCDLLTTDSR